MFYVKNFARRQHDGNPRVFGDKWVQSTKHDLVRVRVISQFICAGIHAGFI